MAAPALGALAVVVRLLEAVVAVAPAAKRRLALGAVARHLATAAVAAQVAGPTAAIPLAAVGARVAKGMAMSAGSPPALGALLPA